MSFVRTASPLIRLRLAVFSLFLALIGVSLYAGQQSRRAATSEARLAVMESKLRDSEARKPEARTTETYRAGVVLLPQKPEPAYYQVHPGNQPLHRPRPGAPQYPTMPDVTSAR